MNNKLNNICKDCGMLGKGCNGCYNPVYTGCVYKIPKVETVNLFGCVWEIVKRYELKPYEMIELNLHYSKRILLKCIDAPEDNANKVGDFKDFANATNI